jgi:hypothetical protein
MNLRDEPLVLNALQSFLAGSLFYRHHQRSWVQFHLGRGRRRSSKYEVRRVQQVRIAKANKGNAVGGVKSDLGVGTRVGDHHVGDAMEPIGTHVDLVVVALMEVIDVASSRPAAQADF